MLFRSELSVYAGGAEDDPARLAQVEERLDQLRALEVCSAEVGAAEVH